MKSKLSRICITIFAMVMFFSVSINVLKINAFAATVPVTWNPNDKCVTSILSNNNLTAQIWGNFPGGVKANTQLIISGKWYWEVKYESGSLLYIGIAGSQYSVAKSTDSQNPTNTARLYCNNGYKTTNVLFSTNYASAFKPGDTIGVLLDMDNGRLEYTLNGISKGVAYTDLKSLNGVYPLITSHGVKEAAGVGTVNFGATPFKYDIPDGYKALDVKRLSAPANISATAGDKEVSLSWDAVEGATKYDVKYGTETGSYTNIITVSDATYREITGLTNGTTYYFAVSAYDGTSESANSIEVSATPLATKPSTPTNLIATAGNTVVNLNWDAVSGVSRYNVKRSITSGGPYDTVVSNVYGTTYSDTGLTNGITYYYVVTALNETVESDNSIEVSAKPMSPNVTLTVEAIDKAKIGDEITVDIVIHNANTICAEDLQINYDTDLLEYVGYVNASGMKVYKEMSASAGLNRYITASLGKDNAANGDKVLLKLIFKAKKAGEAKVDIVKGRIADNATLEMDVLDENCGEKTILIEGIKDVNRTGEFTLLDLGIDAYYNGYLASETDVTKYDADVDLSTKIDDEDLNLIVVEMLKNTTYPGNH